MTHGDRTTKAFSAFIKCLMHIASVAYGSSVFGCENIDTDSISSTNGTTEIEQPKLSVQKHFQHHDDEDEDCREKCCSGSCDCSHANCFQISLLANNDQNKFKAFNDFSAPFKNDLPQSPLSRLLRPPISKTPFSFNYEKSIHARCILP
ncbi:hypothetical protein [Paraglaciecola chathamensis]|jgi:hypothetical protein|uniref:hypothetical protein n=1 Tax=Paraglaciecola chathamensis TaxID=368405 RepID=UPI00020A6610|nr:hypothetical protein [Paraglaciecola oceanifecundans]AEE25388.1 hypothetical protein Glaag_4477 [Glaciecola sp. 4H-3-7+YE-5]|tara:strand:- start:3987 stop:4433 length:447 start_codon:yes stop_codon:yes gene_type:complete